MENTETTEEKLMATSAKKEGVQNPGLGIRHLVVLLGCVGCASLYSMRVNISVAIVSMVNMTGRHDYNLSEADECTKLGNEDANYSSSHHTDAEGEFNWPAGTQGMVLSAFFYGYITTQILGGYAAERIGGKWVYGVGMFFTGLFTMLTPPAARLGPGVLIGCRVLMGVCEGMTLPAMYVVLSKWSHPLERSIFGAAIMSGNELGTVIGQAISGVLAEYGFAGGWPSIFYVFGMFGSSWALLWMFVVYESPELNPHMKEREKAYLVPSTANDDRKKLKTPWRGILTSLPFLATAVGHTAKNWGFYTLLTTLPTFMKVVLHFDIKQNGVLSALPYLAMWVMEIISGQLSDVIRTKGWASTTTVRKVNTGIGLVLPAIFLIAVAFVGCDQSQAVIFLTVSTAFVGFVSSGAQVNHLDIAPNFAGVLMGITNTMATIPGMVSPSISEAITHGSSDTSRWRIVFFIAAAVYAFGGAFFALFGSGVEQEWAKVAPSHLEMQEKEKLNDTNEVNGVPITEKKDLTKI